MKHLGWAPKKDWVGRRGDQERFPEGDTMIADALKQTSLQFYK